MSQPVIDRRLDQRELARLRALVQRLPIHSLLRLSAHARGNRFFSASMW